MGKAENRAIGYIFAIVTYYLNISFFFIIRTKNFSSSAMLISGTICLISILSQLEHQDKSEIFAYFKGLIAVAFCIFSYIFMYMSVGVTTMTSFQRVGFNLFVTLLAIVYMLAFIGIVQTKISAAYCVGVTNKIIFLLLPIFLNLFALILCIRENVFDYHIFFAITHVVFSFVAIVILRLANDNTENGFKKPKPVQVVCAHVSLGPYKSSDIVDVYTPTESLFRKIRRGIRWFVLEWE